jgi:membrane protein DedA with SNARE-associated domain
MPVLFAVVLMGSAGLPLPGVILVIAAGALVQQGELNLWWVIGLTCSAAILGDSIGYAIGLTGGRRLAHRITGRFGGQSRLLAAEALARKWGGPGIFFSRWLLTPLGSSINLVSGMAAYPYHRFLFFDVTGEILWAIEYVLLGVLLGNRLGSLMDLESQIPWIVVGLIGAAIFGRGIVRYVRNHNR